MNLSSFIHYIKGKGGFVRIGILLGVGILLILLATGGRETEAEALTDEQRLEELCSAIEGVGECRVYLVYSTSGYGSSAVRRVESVAVVCQGGDSVEVERRLTELLTSLFDIGSNRVSINCMDD